uniref:RagB/SusD family nutrient uptake outer membrane protein n=1 Tax=Muriicola sp. TaxID=2020856 RepID=UPI00356B22C0
MKNYKKIFYLFGLVTVLVACNDAIDIDQPGRLDADAAFESVADLQSGLFGVYANYDLSGEIAFSSIFTDELSIGFDNGGQGLADYGFVLNAGSTAPASFWTGGYAAINSANRLIEAAKIITPEAGEQTQYNNILGQAYFLRAWAHWFLMEYFTTDYADDNALGIIALDRVPTIDEQLLRNTNGEVYALILADLDRAQNLIGTDTSDPTFANRDAVTALRARIAAYRENYTLAASLSQQLLDKYGLANRAQYEAMFLDTD